MSRLPEAVRKQAEAANAMIKGAGNTDTPAASTSQDSVVANTGTPQVAAPDQSNTDQPVQKLDKPLGADDDAWQERYKILQGKYNAEVPSLHEKVRDLTQRLTQQVQQGPSAEELSTLRSENDSLKKRIEQLEQAGARSTTSTESPDIQKLREEYPAQLVDGLLAVVRGMIEPVAQRVNTVDQNLTRSSHGERVEKLRATLRAQGIDYDQVNTDPLFVTDFLGQRDEYSGEVLSVLLHNAFERGDIARTAKFFSDYATGARKKSPGADTSSGSLDQHVIVHNAGSQGTPSGDTRIWNEDSIRKFYEDKRRGVYTPEKAAALEKEIFASIRL